MKKSMCAKWFEIKLWKKLIILFPITFIIIFVTLFETTPVNLNASNISEIYIGMHSMMTDDIITGKASIKGREDVKNVVCSLNRIKAIRGKYSAEELSGEPPQAMITCYGESGKEIYTVKFYDGFMMVDNELYRITGKVYKELAELCDKYGECQINWVSQGGLWNIRKSKLTKSVFINIIDTDFWILPKRYINRYELIRGRIAYEK